LIPPTWKEMGNGGDQPNRASKVQFTQEWGIHYGCPFSFGSCGIA